MVAVFMASLGFSKARMLGQLRNTVCQWYPSDACVADSYKSTSPNHIAFCLCFYVCYTAHGGRFPQHTLFDTVFTALIVTKT